MYVLKIIKGVHIGKYVGRKGIRSWDWKPQEDINNARVFASIGGIKSFHGIVHNNETQKKRDELHKHFYPSKDFIRNLDYKERAKLYRKFREVERSISIPYTNYYEVIKLKL